MTLSERIHRLLVWAGFQMAPRSPAFNRDEALASMQLYSTEKRNVRKTPNESPCTVGAVTGATPTGNEVPWAWVSLKH